MKNNNDDDVLKNKKDTPDKTGKKDVPVKSTKKDAPDKPVNAEPKESFKEIKADFLSKREEAKQARNQKKEIEKQKVLDIRAQNEKNNKRTAEIKQRRKSELGSLSNTDKKAFLANEKTEKQKSAKLVRAEKAKQKTDYSHLTRDGKKKYRKEQFELKQLNKKAKKGYVAKQAFKYALIAALALLVAYGANVAWALLDNSYAFQNTDQAVLAPSPTRTQAQPEQEQTTPTQSISEAPITPEPTDDPYELLLSQADLDFMEDRVNILVLGIDESLERSNWGSFRTDTIILVSIDFETNDVYMISLPRDSYVWIYNKDRRGKINSAFSAGGGKDKSGFEYTMNTVSMALGGIPVNHYVCFDMNVVKEVVNSIGGLYYDVDINVKMCGRTIDKGYQYMDGQMVLDYARQRKGDSDVARADRQQKIIFAIFDEVKRSGQIQDIPSIYSAVTGNIYTDLDFTQIVSLAAFAMNIDMEDLHRYMLPGGFLNIDGASLWGVNQYEKRSMVKEIFGVDIKISEDDNVTGLQKLAAQKRKVVAEANAAAASATAFVNANSAYIEPAELDAFNSKTANLRAVAAEKNLSNVAETIPPIISAIEEYKTWIASLKATVEARVAAPPPTPTPSPSLTLTPTQTPAHTP